MIWASWSDFFAMGGYAFYVWGAYGVTFACLAVEIVLLVRRRKAALALLSRYGAGAGASR
jgi:heme exporter protein D